MQDKKACRTTAAEEFKNLTAVAMSGVSARAREAYFEKLQRDTAKDKAKDGLRSCLTDISKTKREVETCMATARTNLDAELDNYIKDGKAATQRTQQKREMEKEASRDVLGDVFTGCIQAGTDRKACLDRLKNLKDGAGLQSEDPVDIVKRSLSKVLMKPSSNCTTDLKTCREEAKNEAISKGLKQNEYAAVKKMGEVKAAAEMWATCKEAGDTDANCEALVKDEFVRVSGALDTDFDAAMKQRIMRLGNAIKDGESIVVVKFKRMLVTALASSAACESAKEDVFAAKALAVAQANDTRATSSRKLRCRLTDAKPEYNANVDANISDSELEDLSETTASGLVGETLRRRLAQLDSLGRRLASVSETYAAQDVSECGASDAACASGQTTVTPSPIPAPTPPPAPGPLPTPIPRVNPSGVSGAPRTAPAAAGFLLAAGMALLHP